MTTIACRTSMPAWSAGSSSATPTPTAGCRIRRRRRSAAGRARRLSRGRDDHGQRDRPAREDRLARGPEERSDAAGCQSRPIDHAALDDPALVDLGAAARRGGGARPDRPAQPAAVPGGARRAARRRRGRGRGAGELRARLHPSRRLPRRGLVHHLADADRAERGAGPAAPPPAARRTSPCSTRLPREDAPSCSRCRRSGQPGERGGPHPDAARCSSARSTRCPRPSSWSSCCATSRG